MNLSGLPAEIINGICQFIGFQTVRRRGGMICDEHQDFKALRSTCRELYFKTTHDASVRYSIKLEELEIYLDYDSFVQLLYIAKVPHFRDRVHNITLHAPEQRIEDEDEDNKEAIAVRYALTEETEGFRQSSEAVHLLAESFRSLEAAANLQRIELFSNQGHSLVLEAMRLGLFSRKLAYLVAEPHHFTNFGYGSFATRPEDFTRYVKGLRIQPFLAEEHDKLRPVPLSQQQEHTLGLHIRYYRPTSPGFTKFVSSLANVDSLELNGCNQLRLRLCHGCHDLFTKTFAPLFFPNLSSLTLANTLISGSRLRGFIKRHASTLSKVEMNYTTLTDGSWRSIAQGLAKLVHLQELRFTTLRQKRAANTRTNGTAWPPGYYRTSQIRLGFASDIQHYLQVFIATFSTVSCNDPARFRRTPPKCFEAKLYEAACSGRPFDQLDAIAIM